MDAALLFILPLIGGYQFSKNFLGTRFACERESGHRLYFRAALYGVLLFAISSTLHTLLNETWPAYSQAFLSIHGGPAEYLFAKDHKTGFEHLVVVSAYSLILGVVAPVFINLLLRLSWSLTQTIYSRILPDGTVPASWLNPRYPPFFWYTIKKNEVEQMFVEAVSRGMPVMLSLESGKVYVGFVTETIQPSAERRAIIILPILSGYRDEKTHQVYFTTRYQEVYDYIEEGRDPNINASVDDFEIVIPTDRIETARMFDIEAYARFHEDSEQG